MSGAPTFETGTRLDAVARDAGHSARAAVDACGVSIREVEQPRDLEEVSQLLSVVWNREVASRQITPELLRALTTTGNYVAGAFADGLMIGAAVAFFASPPLNSMHSHITGVADGDKARGVGYALKLHQRAWALVRGIETITWTFDPLVRRNAYFNVAKLGAGAVEYLPNFYGEMRDLINAGDQSDRLLVEWDLRSPGVVSVCDQGGAAPSWDGEAVAAVLRVGAGERPSPAAWDGSRATVAVPADIEAMRLAAPELAREWRLALRDVLGAAMANGARLVGFRREDGYMLEIGAERAR